MKTQRAMKKQILSQLNKIKKAAEATGMTGQIQLHFSGIHVDEWERVLESITEYKMYRHFASVTDKCNVALLLD
jgi:hypothetical protein